MENLFINTLNHRKTNSTPIWFMRQAGRYLPEYMEIKNKRKSFWDMCFNTDTSVEITMQPIRRFGFDAAVIFSDILIIPYAMGQHIEFIANVGPQAEPISTLEQLYRTFDQTLNDNNICIDKLQPVYDSISQVSQKVPVIGFVGGPFTLMMYSIGAKQSKFKDEFNMIMDNKQLLHTFQSAFINVISAHAIAQIQAGAKAVQLFESFAGLINDENIFDECIFESCLEIIYNIKNHPISKDSKIIMYGSNSKFINKFKESVDFISIHHDIDKFNLHQIMNSQAGIQGNLSPELILNGTKDDIQFKTMQILDMFKDKPHIFNLGHGIHKNTPIVNVEYVLQKVREFIK